MTENEYIATLKFKLYEIKNFAWSNQEAIDKEVFNEWYPYYIDMLNKFETIILEKE